MMVATANSLLAAEHTPFDKVCQGIERPWEPDPMGDGAAGVTAQNNV